MRSSLLKPLALVLLSGVALAACSKQDNPLKIKRSVCPAVGVLQNAGELTYFSPETSRDQSAIDVTAEITNVRAGCSDVKNSATISSTVSFDIVAQRRSTSGARDVPMPYFAASIRGGDKLIGKQIGQIMLHFDDGQARAQGSASAKIVVARAETALPDAVNAKLNKKRKASDFDAGVDPMTEPTVKAAVLNASFELLIGFQLTNAGVYYNITK